MNIGIIIILLIVVLGAVCTLFYVVSLKQIKKKKQNYINTHEEIKTLDDKIQTELSRTKKISKNEESIKLFDRWLEEYNVYSKQVDAIDDSIRRMSKNARFRYRSDFDEYANTLDIQLDGFLDELEALYNKLKQYTSYELENTRISLDLKERIKELSIQFDTHLRYLEFYNSSFEERVIEVNEGINMFEEFQRDGEYTDGRNILKVCSEQIDFIDYVLNLILKLHESLKKSNSKISVIEELNDAMNEANFNINLEDFKQRLSDFKDYSNVLANKNVQIEFNKETKLETLNLLEVEHHDLDRAITKYLEIVQQKTTAINEIIEYIKQNDELIQKSEDIISGAIDERNSIAKMYNFDDVEKILHNFDHEINTFDQFSADYEELIEIIYSGQEDYARLKTRIEQANKYLLHLLENIRRILNNLRDIRTDEIKARQELNDYKQNLIEIDLYLRKHDHHNLVSSDLQNMIDEVNIKVDLLEKTLSVEPLFIADVRNLRSSIIATTNEIINEKLENNIKQREAAKLLIFYFNKFTHTREGNTYSRRFNTLYNEHDYKRILREGHELLIESNKDGHRIYEKIVSPAQNTYPFVKVLPNTESNNEVVKKEA